MVRAIYNGLYARMPAYGKAEVAVRARTHDRAPTPVDAATRAEAVRGVVDIYSRGLMTAESLLSVVASIAAEKKT